MLVLAVTIYLVGAYVTARVVFACDEFADDSERPFFLFLGLAWPMLLMVAPVFVLALLIARLGDLLIPSKHDGNRL